MPLNPPPTIATLLSFLGIEKPFLLETNPKSTVSFSKSPILMLPPIFSLTHTSSHG